MRRVENYRRWPVLLFLILMAWMPASLRAQDDAPPARVARLSYLKGNVSLQAAGATQWSQATLNYPLTTGDRIYTYEGSQAELEVGSIAVRATEGTDLTVANLNDQMMQLGLGSGTIRVRLFDLRPGDSVEVDTPNGALTLERAGDYRVDTFPNDGATLAVVNRGTLEVSGGNVLQRVDGGQAVKLTGTDPIVVSPVEIPAPDGFDQWCQERDRRFEASASARYVGREVPGYYDLDGYGRWREEHEYGPIWYPTAVPVGWVPYRYGRWVWISPWGWTWVEDEPWGYCPFHYGRWVFVGGAWGWVPGPVVVRPYYAPALVAFVGGPNFGVAITVGRPVGWFPLGPTEPYYPWYHYDQTYLREVNVTNVRNVTNITNITNVTNVTNINNIRYVNRTVATTVVSSETFRNGQAVGRQVIRVDRNQLAQAQIIPHPRFAPASNALSGGRPVANPPRIARPVMIPAAGRASMPATTRTGPPEANVPARTAPGAPPPVFTRTAPPATTPPAQAGPASRPSPIISRTPPPGAAAPRAVGPANAPSKALPPLITRTPPPATVPLPVREKAWQVHPGRPLEPQQVRNLQAGKPAGPMRDREFPPHPPQAQSSAPKARAPKSRGAEKSAPRQPKESKRERP